MATDEPMTIIFPEPLALQIRESVEAGDYATTGEAVRDAVRLWGARRQSDERDTEMLRREWDAGKASGSAGPLDMASLIAAAKAERNADEGGALG